MYERRSGHSAKNFSRDDPNELNRAGRRGSVVPVCWPGVVVVDLAGGVVEVVVEVVGTVPGVVLADRPSLPKHPLNPSVVTATTIAVGRARVMLMRRVQRGVWFPAIGAYQTHRRRIS